MNTFTDYYTLLGIDRDASPDAIKAAFKKLALQYHPDVYKGQDAHERMRLLLRAYQTLNDPVTRRQYDAQRSEHIADEPRPRSSASAQRTPPRKSSSTRRSGTVITPDARRDRQRYYDFPDFYEGRSVHIDLIDTAYTLSAEDAQELLQQGMLRGFASKNEERKYYCHRCHHSWEPSQRKRAGYEETPDYCPKCRADDWTEYLLLRCVHCTAVFESEQIRYEIGSYSYGRGRYEESANLCPPYELFPLCPYCGTAHWCPAEEDRVSNLRQRAAEQRASIIRMIWIGAALMAIVLGSVVALGILQ